MKITYVLSLVVCIYVAACATLPPPFEAQTPDERAIVGQLKMLEEGYNTGDVEKHIAPYASDAVIETLLLEGRAVSRDQYAEVLRSRPLSRRSTIEVRPVTVKVQSADQAEATAIIRRAPSEGGEVLGQRNYRLARREGQWRIVEARYSR